MVYILLKTDGETGSTWEIFSSPYRDEAEAEYRRYLGTSPRFYYRIETRKK